MAEERSAREGIDDLLAAARSGSARAAGRLLTHVEGDARDVVLEAIGPAAGEISAIGITGPPGAGKSTTITALVAAYRAAGKRVAVLAVDPTSPYSGGALLGDRIRMTQHIDDRDVLIRSMATRGHLGGLASAVPAAIRLLEALDYDIVLVETVGVGQSEIEVSAVADPTVVILNPGAGDAVQAAKAGLLEVADLLVVNKADREGADQTVRDLRMESSVPVLTLIASRGEGVSALIEAIEGHRRDDDAARRAARLRGQILSLAMSRLRTHPALADLVDAVVQGGMDPYTAAEKLIAPV
ncbi:methylmalonyl Co-A mutase-associated GTPase MeaB [Gordonia insulae]|uniref:Putative GTPase n=1 Tax=Gordonia insulae TaxID=2420509 RepID=A0A3G8JLN8_9ACTN|nr:methylmalonyl Co-A mutase-associated GTPase MeaB [Gordonia insulae]AZG45798.1 putative GTPase [Gordonia insulae]